MLSFDEKIALLETFPELERKNVSLGRVNFHYEDSAHDKKTVVYHLHPNGNGFVYAGMLPEYEAEVNDKGFVNIREFGAEQLRMIVGQAIRSLSSTDEAPVQDGEEAETAVEEQLWVNPDNEKLRVFYEDELWYVYSGENLETAFETYEEVEEYMAEEGFNRT